MTSSDMKAAAAAAAKKLERFSGPIVSIGVAQRLVRDCAWWYGHPHGPTRAPKHYERVVKGRHGWELEFGANYFLVEKAIRQRAGIIARAASAALVTGRRIDSRPYVDEMALAVRGAVANFNGDEYTSYYDIRDGFMLFGTQAIRVQDFVSTMCELSGFHLIAI